ncbi:MAG TPA: hypothetical protein VE972_12050 [Conexibacter sp.]|nr:hypothetical protein [Conexibacter sp.]
MAGTPVTSGARDAAAAPARASFRTPTPAETAWIAALPCALVTVAAIYLIGPPLGRALLSPGSATFWRGVGIMPEPVEHGRYAVALVGPLLLALVTFTRTRRPQRPLPAALIRALVVLSQALTAGFLVACLLAQHDVLLRADVPPQQPDQIFTLATLAAAAALALVFLVGVRIRPLVARAARAVRETGTRRGVCVVVAAAFTAAWLLTAINTDASAGKALGNNLLPWDASETFAVLNGRTPLVDFHAQYSQLWPLLAAAVMALTGSATLIAWTTTMATISGLAMLGIYAVFRRITRSSVLALALYLPFLATSYFIATNATVNRFSPAGIFSIWPMRYGAPYLLAWLTVRHVGGAGPRRAWLLFTAAGLVAINNPEFGIGAFAATLAALACGEPSRSLRAVRRLLAGAGAGLLGAGLLVALVTLVRSGQLPHFGWVLEYSRLYGVEGWALEPMAWIGLHIAIYVTFAAAIGVAAVRVVERRREPLLTSMLAWSGVFGLFAASYYVGRSDPLNLVCLLSAWCLALTLLLVAVVRGQLARGWRRPGLAGVAVVFGFALAICSLSQLPTPWSQIARMRHHTRIPIFEQPRATRFVAQATTRGEHVGILIALGHRIAHEVGVVNVAPYASIVTMPTVQQLRRTIAVLRAAHARKLFVAQLDLEQGILPEELALLRREGFTAVRRDAHFTELLDMRPEA